jgi:hypothetical protein
VIKAEEIKFVEIMSLNPYILKLFLKKYHHFAEKLEILSEKNYLMYLKTND